MPNTVNGGITGQPGAELLVKIPEVASSTGSACHEGKVKLSPVLPAMGASAEFGQGAVRISVGIYTTDDEVDRAARLIVERL